MKIVAGLICLTATPALANFDCVLRDLGCVSQCKEISVKFAIDTAQFVAPQNPNDPPRRQITTVTQDRDVFSAEAILMPGGVRGFHEDAGEIGSRLMIVQPDGTARLTLQPANLTLAGQCEVLP
ncbi:hypothetical protein L0664_06470 [Octadecabacter sp. G9-8]|uniref:Uncharacterized protein n=1 Tax=Octadecabacter dasysiphoniae TaxID=2909341 RepID=A0ABS9CWE2_9RHOB|nr:hypothetical protein [Octadecabacter dasysiphoniae]MCF2870705.1 hypothetical protein [Octadecabacter dasysiphoniae]